MFYILLLTMNSSIYEKLHLFAKQLRLDIEAGNLDFLLLYGRIFWLAAMLIAV